MDYTATYVYEDMWRKDVEIKKRHVIYAQNVKMDHPKTKYSMQNIFSRSITPVTDLVVKGQIIT